MARISGYFLEKRVFIFIDDKESAKKMLEMLGDSFVLDTKKSENNSLSLTSKEIDDLYGINRKQKQPE